MSLMNFREPNQVKWVGVRPAHNGTQIAKQATAIDQTTVLHTVTSGKTLFIATLIIEFDSTVSGVVGNVRVRDTSDVTMFDIVTCVMREATQELLSIPFNPPLEIAEGYDIVLVSNNSSMRTIGFIHGWEE